MKKWNRIDRFIDGMIEGGKARVWFWNSKTRQWEPLRWRVCLTDCAETLAYAKRRGICTAVERARA